MCPELSPLPRLVLDDDKVSVAPPRAGRVRVRNFGAARPRPVWIKSLERRRIMEKLSKASVVPIASEPAEKRRHPRFPFSSGGEAVDLQANVHVTGRLSDISRSGCYMDTISPFAVDAAIILTVTHEGRTFKTKAKVVYSLNGMGMGITFTTTEPDQARVLDAWLAELGGLIHLAPN